MPIWTIRVLNSVDTGKGYPMVYVDTDGITQTLDLNADFLRIKRQVGQLVKVSNAIAAVPGVTPGLMP